jgi:proteasome accessory factor B
MPDVPAMLRQWSVLKTLSARRNGATLRELADDAGVSQKTITRDLALLRRIGFPVQDSISEHGRKHWKLDGATGLPTLRFTLEEAAALYLGRQFLEALAGTLFWSAANSAFRKIQATLGDPAIRHLGKLACAVYLKTHALADYSSRAQLIDQLMVAIEDRRLTVLEYQSLRSTEPVSYYDVHPYALVHHRGALYCVGWSKDHDGLRTFKVDRISAVDVLQLQFERQEDFNAEHYLAHSFGIFAADGPPQTLRVRFAGPAIRILDEKQFHASQKVIPQPDGSVIVEYELAAFEEFVSFILSWGPHAEVLEPAELRARVQHSLAAALGLYNGPERRNSRPGNTTRKRME